MNAEFYDIFIEKAHSTVKSDETSIEDLCEIFNILVDLTAYSPKHTEMSTLHHEILGRLRANSENISVEILPELMSQLVEF